MSVDQQIQDGDKPRPRPFQFTLRSLLAAITFTSVYLSCLFGGPPWVAVIATVFVFLAAQVTFVTILVYGHGYQRTFCIGALAFLGTLIMMPYGFPYHLLYLLDVEDEESVVVRCYVLIGLLVGVLAATVFGLLAIWVRRMVEPTPSASKNPPDESTTDDPQSPSG